MPPAPHTPRLALVHDWLTGMRGGEKCLEALCEVYPDAPIYTLLHIPGSVSPVIERHRIHTSFIQHLPSAATRYRQYLPLFPFAIERFALRDVDIVISSSHCVAKGILTPPGALHLCYCHTPMRYIWHLYDDYFGPGRAGLATRLAMRSVVGWLRRWDRRSALRPHHFVANSRNVAQRINAIYHRDADVIYPPVETSRLHPESRDEGYFLMVTAMVPYKRVDLAVQAFTRMGERLVVVGDGPDLERVRLGAGPTVTFRGWVGDAALRELYAGCSALIFPGEEDFGIVPVEAMACGKPVLAFGKGGALETVGEHNGVRTGVLFDHQSVEDIIQAVATFRSTRFDPAAIRGFALTFDREHYKRRMAEYVSSRWEAFSRSTIREQSS